MKLGRLLRLAVNSTFGARRIAGAVDVEFIGIFNLQLDLTLSNRDRIKLENTFEGSIYLYLACFLHNNLYTLNSIANESYPSL